LRRQPIFDVKLLWHRSLSLELFEWLTL
jgi:hypothetical protein